MPRCLTQLLRRPACALLAASAVAGCSLTFDGDELTSGSAGESASRLATAGGAGKTASGGMSGTAAAGGGGRAGSAGSAGQSGVGGRSGATSGGGSSGQAGASGASGTSMQGARRIFWLEQGSDGVHCADADGSNPDRLIDIGASSYLRSIAIDPQASRLYYSDDQQGRIERASLTGANRGNVVASLDKPVGIDIDVARGKLYFTEQGRRPALSRVNLDGSELEPLLTTGLEHPYGIALDLDAGHVYLVDNGVNAVFRANLDGSSLTNLNVPEVDLPIQISLDPSARKLYWSEIGDVKRIRRANLDGSEAENVVTRATFSAFSQPLGLKVDVSARALYFVDGSSIRRSNLDGSGVVSVLTGLDGPVGLALVY